MSFDNIITPGGYVQLCKQWKNIPEFITATLQSDIEKYCKPGGIYEVYQVHPLTATLILNSNQTRLAGVPKSILRAVPSPMFVEQVCPFRIGDQVVLKPNWFDWAFVPDWHYDKETIEVWLQADRVTTGVPYRVMGINPDQSIVVDPSPINLNFHWNMFRSADAPDNTSTPARRSSEERVELGKQMVRDMFNSAERFEAYYQLFLNKP